MKSLLALARPDIRAMTPYSSARNEQSIGEIWLNANENPWVDNAAALNRYPEPQPTQLLAKLSELYQIPVERLLVGRGSDEAIDLLLRVFCAAGQEGILICPPTYGMYQISAQIQQASITRVPLLTTKQFALDIEAVLAAWRPNIKLIFLCSPNNPTGNLLETHAILQLCQQLTDKALVVVDEAYIEFASQPSLAAQLENCSNLVILRTLSKAYGLAGVRCGVVAAHPVIIQLLRQVLAPYPIPRPVVDIVLAHLTPEKLRATQERIQILIQQRQYLWQALQKMSFVTEIWPSEANFILMRTTNAAQIYQHCLSHGVVLRDRSRELGLDNCIRISVGTPEENQRLLMVLNDVKA